MSSTSRNILLCAYACEPYKGSEPGVGWDTSIHLAKQDPKTNYHVITRKNNKETIEKEDTPINLSFIYYDLPIIFLFIKRKIPFVRIYYYLWMIGAVAKLWRRRREFQIIHHITFVNDWFPSFFILLKNKTNFFVWGPIGSNNQIESKFLYSKKHKYAEKAKNIFIKIIRRLDIFFWICKIKSDVIIGTSNNVKKTIRLQNKHLYKFKSMPAIAIKKSNLKKVENNNFDQFKVISAGQIRYIKNFRVTIKSFSNFLNLVSEEEKNLIQLQIVGSGSQKAELVRYVKELGITKHVDFLGQVKQSELMTCFKEAQLFLFPTLENAGFVILEAMSYYLPVVALDYGGPKQFVKKNVKNQLVSCDLSIEKIENELASRVYKLYKSLELRNKVGIDNFKTIEEWFTWEQKTASILNVYKNLIQK